MTLLNEQIIGFCPLIEDEKLQGFFIINKKEIKQYNARNEMRRGCCCNLSLTGVLTAPEGSSKCLCIIKKKQR